MDLSKGFAAGCKSCIMPVRIDIFRGPTTARVVCSEG
jgi:hypothetical protein